MKTTGANDILGSLSPASLPDRAVTYAIDIAKSVYRLILRRIERTQDKVNSEYNLLHWQKILSNKAWNKAKDLADFLAPPDLERAPAKGRQSDPADRRVRNIISIASRAGAI